MREHGKIDALNSAIYEMIESLQGIQQVEDVSFLLTIVGFEKGTIKEFYHGVNVKEIKWENLPAKGVTPLGDAFLKVATLVECESVVPHNSYAPIIVLVSDGQPTDDEGHLSDNWEKPLTQMKDAPRVNKGMCFSMAIGPDANEDMLLAFSSNGRVFHAEDGNKIRQFFQLVTMATTMSIGLPVSCPNEIKENATEFLSPPEDGKTEPLKTQNEDDENSVTIVFENEQIL
jgi:uncharacterized protein YegL